MWPTKDDLVDGMVDTLIGDAAGRRAPSWEVARPGPGDDIGHTRRHHEPPLGPPGLRDRTLRTPAVLGYMERLSQIFLRAGFSADLTHHVMHLLGARIWGSARSCSPAPDGVPTAQRRVTSGTPDPAHYPRHHGHRCRCGGPPPGAASCDEDAEFDFALEVILDGIARPAAPDGTREEARGVSGFHLGRAKTDGSSARPTSPRKAAR